MLVRKLAHRFVTPFVKFHRNAQQLSGSLRLSQEIGVPGYSLLAIPVITFGLGTWQVHRRNWKLRLIEELTQKQELPPVDLPERWDDLASMEYQRVRVVGSFDHAREIYVSPRSVIRSGGKDEQPGGLLSSSSSTGALVITPFKLKDRDATILINRGWVPRAKTNPMTRKEGQVEGEIELTGIVRAAEKRPPLGPKNSYHGVFWHYKDLDGIASFCGTDPVLLDADAASTIEGGPLGGQTKVTLRNEHLSYIVTWYSLSAATSFLWYTKYIRGKLLL